MAAKTGVLDAYANVAAMKLTESATNTLTVAKFAFPFSIMDKIGLIVSRIEYELASFTSVFANTADRVCLALTCGAAPADVEDPTDPLVIDSVRFSRYDFGTAASGFMFRQPFVKDFSNLPGGGLLVAPSPLYAAIKGNSAGAAGSMTMRLYYTYIELAADEYWQLVESRRIISS